MDSATRIDNALKVAGLSGQELEKVYSRLRDSAVKNAAPLETLVTLYGRISLVQKELGVSQDEIVNFTDKIAVALRVSGQSAAESAGALMQLSQALGSGTVRAEEFQSILEGAQPIAQAAAAGLKEAGGSVARLRELVVDGKISSETFFRAFEAGSVILEERVSSAQLTTEQAMQNIRTALIDATRDFAKGSLAADDLATAFVTMAQTINELDFEAFGVEVKRVIDWIADLKEAVNFAQNISKDIGASTGLNSVGEWLTGGEDRSFLGGTLTIKSTKGRKGLWEKLAEQDIKDRNEAYAKVLADPSKYGPQLPDLEYSRGPSVRGGKRGSGGAETALEPISINDRPLPSGGDKKGGKGGGSKSVKQTADSRFDADIQAIRDRTAALIEEQKIVGLSYREQEQRRMALDLEQSALADLREEARRKGKTDLDNIKLSETQIEKIREASAAYAEQADKLRLVEEAQQRTNEAASEFYDTFKSEAMEAIRGAKSLGDVLESIASKLADMALNSAFDALFQPKSGSSSGGLLGGIFDAIGGMFRANGGPVKAGQPYIVGERQPELFVPRQSGHILPQVPTMPNLSTLATGRQQAVNATFAPVYNVQGSGPEIDRLRQQMAQDRADFHARVVQSVRQAKATRNL